MKSETPCKDRSVIFIRVNKTAGTSIRHALNLPLGEHKTAMEKRKDVGEEVWRSSFIFSIVRNPWDRVVSLYHHRVKTNQTGLGDNPILFKDWVRYVFVDTDPVYYDKPKMLMPQYDWIVDSNGLELVHFIGRFENIEQDFKTICAEINYVAKLPHMKQSERSEYQNYYDEETFQIIDKFFFKDIQHFGYVF